MDKVKHVAVIMPFKNNRDTIKDSANFVLYQVYASCMITLVCVDDGSTDGSLDIVKRLMTTGGRNLVVISNDRGPGPANARNSAIDYIKASDEFTHVAFCDSDDRWILTHLGQSLLNISNSGADMVYSGVDAFNEHNEPLQIFGIPNPDIFDHDLLKTGNYIFISTVVMDVKCLSVGHFNPAAVPMEDWEYWLRVADSYKIWHDKNASVRYLWKTGGSYYTAEESQAAKLRIMNDMRDPMNVEGWLSRAEGEFLAKNASGRRCIEIGSYKGKSANFIAPHATSLVCIDTFKADGGGQTQMDNPTTYTDFARNTVHLNNVVPLIGMSHDVHSFLKNDDYDFIFIDGMHDYDSVMSDVKNYIMKLRDDAVIMFHDYFERDWPGVVKCVNELFGGPDELVDSVAKVTITKDRRFDLMARFSNIHIPFQVVVPVMPMATPDQLTYIDYVYSDKTKIKSVIISPWSAQLPDGKENPKNYPYWSEVVTELRKRKIMTVQIGRSGEKPVGCDSFETDLNDDNLKFLLAGSDAFISVDSFLPHFSAYHNKKGVVIFGKSDPEIFGHSLHVNLLKSREYLRPDQFRWWRDVSYDEDAFVSVNEVVSSLLKLLGMPEIYKEQS